MLEILKYECFSAVDQEKFNTRQKVKILLSTFYQLLHFFIQIFTLLLTRQNSNTNWRCYNNITLKHTIIKSWPHLFINRNPNPKIVIKCLFLIPKLLPESLSAFYFFEAAMIKHEYNLLNNCVGHSFEWRQYQNLRPRKPLIFLSRSA